MANNSAVTQEVLQNTLERYHEDFVYPYLNGATHTGCVPLGTILPYFGETAPTHFLICDGTTYNKADYPELAAHLLALTDPSPYVVSGDNTKFKVPDLRGEFLRGTGTNSHSNQGSGGNVGVHQDATEQNMIFTEASDGNTYYRMANRSYGKNMDGGYGNSGSLGAYRMLNSGSLIDWTNQPGATYKVRPTNTSVTYIIAYRNAYIDLALDSFPIDITQPTDGQLLMYDATAGRWVNAEIDTKHNYSTTEHVVGTWIDGRNIYEKTIYFGNLPNKAKKNVAHGIVNLDKVISFSGFAYYSNYFLSLPKCAIESSSWGVDIFIEFADSITIQTGEDRSSFIAYITIQYTKTTDTV